jgi:hypothetical protein
VGRLIKPEDHPQRGCKRCREVPYCSECWDHHRPLTDAIPKVLGPVSTRAVSLDVFGDVEAVLGVFPAGVAGARELAVRYALDHPGRKTAAEKQGVWFNPSCWERFLVAGPFDRKGVPVHVEDAASKLRAAYLAEQARAAEVRQQVAPLGRKGRPRRR